MTALPRIAVIGTSHADQNERDQAHEVGRLLAEAGCLVLNGGLGGVMAASSRGASEAGGTVVGLLPGVDGAAANEWVTIPVPTGLREARNVVLVHAAEAFIAIGRGYGTLSEIAIALREGKRVVGLASWDIEGMTTASSPAEAVERILSGLRS